MKIKELVKKVETLNKLNEELGFDNRAYIEVEDNGRMNVINAKELKVFLDERYDSKTIKEEIYPTELEKVNEREYLLDKKINIGPYEYDMNIKITLWSRNK